MCQNDKFLCKTCDSERWQQQRDGPTLALGQLFNFKIFNTRQYILYFYYNMQLLNTFDIIVKFPRKR